MASRACVSNFANARQFLQGFRGNQRFRNTAHKKEHKMSKVAQVFRARFCRGVWSLHTACPFCKKTHYHGGQSGLAPEIEGNRCRHCLPQDLKKAGVTELGTMGGYDLVPSPDIKIEGEELARAYNERKSRATKPKA